MTAPSRFGGVGNDWEACCTGLRMIDLCVVLGNDWDAHLDQLKYTNTQPFHPPNPTCPRSTIFHAQTASRHRLFQMLGIRSTHIVTTGVKPAVRNFGVRVNSASIIDLISCPLAVKSFYATDPITSARDTVALEEERLHSSFHGSSLASPCGTVDSRFIHTTVSSLNTVYKASKL